MTPDIEHYDDAGGRRLSAGLALRIDGEIQRRRSGRDELEQVVETRRTAYTLRVPWPRRSSPIRSRRSRRPSGPGSRRASRRRPRPRRRAGRPSPAASTRSSTPRRGVARPWPRSSTRSTDSPATRARRRTKGQPGHVRVLYISPLKALTYDVERNLRAPLTGIGLAAQRLGERAAAGSRVASRTGDTPGRGPPRDRPPPARHPHHDPGEPVPPPDEPGPRDPARRRARHRRRGPRDRRHEARCPPRPEPGAPRGPAARGRPAAAADRPQRHAATARRDRPLPRRHRAGPRGHDRRCRRAQAARAPGHRPGRRHERHRRRPAPGAAARRPGHQPGPAHEHLAGHPPGGSSSSSGATRSTIVFTNSRRLSERLAQRLNELAGEELVRAHHGSIAREQRLEIEEELKAGRLPALVATSSLELGIDMGAVDLVIQVESPTSVARGLQRVGRAGHQVGAPSKGVIFPKYRGDLLEVRGRHPADARGRDRGDEDPAQPARRPRPAARGDDRHGPLDRRRPAPRRSRARRPYETLTRDVLDGVLGMLAGAYPSDEFAELKPRVVWDRVTDTIEGRRDARVVAVTSGGTIPDRGLFGVFMEGEAGTPGRRVGELDEEMVYELRAGMHGDVIVLGASSWRVAGDRPRPGHGQPGARRPRQAPVLEGRRGRPADRARSGASARSSARSRPTWRAAPTGRRDGHAAPARAPRPRRAGRREPRRLPRGRARGDRRPADRQAGRRRALPRRARRLAADAADAVRRPGPRPVVAGHRGAAPGTARHGGPDDLVRRRHRDPDAGGRGEPRRRRGAAVPGGRGRRGPRRRAGRELRAVREPLPRERGPGPAAAAPPAGDADAAVAAAPARGGPARRRQPLRQLPDPRRDVPRVPVGRLRPRRAARDPRRRREPRDRRPRRRDAARRARSRAACCSTTSRPTCTTATRRWPSAGPAR